MEDFILNNNIYLNNNNILFELVIEKLEDIIKDINNNNIINRIKNIIIIINKLINDNKKYIKIIQNDKKINNRQLDDLENINNNHTQTRIYDNGKYEGEFKNDKREGKGIYYFKSGSREMGDYLNDKEIGKHVKLNINGEVTTNNY